MLSTATGTTPIPAGQIDATRPRAPCRTRRSILESLQWTWPCNHRLPSNCAAPAQATNSGSIGNKGRHQGSSIDDCRRVDCNFSPSAVVSCRLILLEMASRLTWRPSGLPVVNERHSWNGCIAIDLKRGGRQPRGQQPTRQVAIAGKEDERKHTLNVHACRISRGVRDQPCLMP